jgi:hypothetical protein
VGRYAAGTLVFLVPDSQQSNLNLRGGLLSWCKRLFFFQYDRDKDLGRI